MDEFTSTIFDVVEQAQRRKPHPHKKLKAVRSKKAAAASKSAPPRKRAQPKPRKARRPR